MNCRVTATVRLQNLQIFFEKRNTISNKSAIFRVLLWEPVLVDVKSSLNKIQMLKRPKMMLLTEQCHLLCNRYGRTPKFTDI